MDSDLFYSVPRFVCSETESRNVVLPGLCNSAHRPDRLQSHRNHRKTGLCVPSSGTEINGAHHEARLAVFLRTRCTACLVVAQSTEALAMLTCSDTVGFPDTYLVKRSSVSLQLSTNTKVTTASLDLERQTVVESQASRQITNACAWQVLSPADHNPDPSSHPRLEEASTPDSK